MAQQLFDDFSHTGLPDDNGVSYFLDDLGNYWGPPPVNRRSRYVSLSFVLAWLMALSYFATVV